MISDRVLTTTQAASSVPRMVLSQNSLSNQLAFHRADYAPFLLSLPLELGLSHGPPSPSHFRMSALQLRVQFHFLESSSPCTLAPFMGPDPPWVCGLCRPDGHTFHTATGESSREAC